MIGIPFLASHSKNGRIPETATAQPASLFEPHFTLEALSMLGEALNEASPLIRLWVACQAKRRCQILVAFRDPVDRFYH